MNGLTLAYLGDAYYELEIRKHLINKGLTKVNDLHNEAVKYTSSVSQAKIINYLIGNNFLNELEMNAYKKGRNHSSTGRKNVDAHTYTVATGFESFIGYLYIENKDRLNEIMIMIIDFVEKGDSHNE